MEIRVDLLAQTLHQLQTKRIDITIIQVLETTQNRGLEWEQASALPADGPSCYAHNNAT
jgi:hypothetical protein